MHIMQSAPGAETVIDGRKYLYFAGTGYFGLQGHPELIAAACDALRKYGISSATSRNGYGDNPPVLEVERRAAQFFGTEDAFYYVSGYCGNAVMAHGLDEQFDVFFLDELSHYSVFDGALQIGKRVVTFRHLSADDLAAKLEADLGGGERPLVMTDGVFAVSGATAPAREYREVLSPFEGAGICLDDAHAVGVLGDNGRGTFEHLGMSGANLFFSGTLSKAFGGHGGIAPGSGALIERLRTKSHLHIGATPPAVPVAAASAKAIELVGAHPELRRKLRANVAVLRGGLRDMGLDVGDSPVPIICVELGDPERMKRIHSELLKRGIAVAFISDYRGVAKEGAIRIAVFATHTHEMLERLLHELRGLL